MASCLCLAAFPPSFSSLAAAAAAGRQAAWQAGRRPIGLAPTVHFRAFLSPRLTFAPSMAATNIIIKEKDNHAQSIHTRKKGLQIDFESSPCLINICNNSYVCLYADFVTHLP
jgi:hypothetical protein